MTDVFPPPAAAVLHIVRPLDAEELALLASRLAKLAHELDDMDVGIDEARVWL